jgi:Tfp pilus assembly protein PilO
MAGLPARLLGYDRGSQKRLNRIRLRGNWSIEVWIFIAILAFMLIVGMPWLIQHRLVDRDAHHTHQE